MVEKININHDPNHYKSWQDKLAPYYAAGMLVLSAVGFGEGYKIHKQHQHNSPTAIEKPIIHIVKPGETEWDLAKLISSNKDPREITSQIDHLLPPDNAHANHTLQPGDKIAYSKDGYVISYSEPAPNS